MDTNFKLPIPNIFLLFLLATIIGILLQHYQILVFIFPITIGLLLLFSQKNYLYLLSGVFVILTSAVYYHKAVVLNLNKNVYGKNINLTGYITDINEIEHKRYSHTITIKSDQIVLDNIPSSDPKTILLYCKDIDNLFINDLIHITGLSKTNRANSSLQKYLLKEGIYATFFCNKNVIFSLLHRPAFSITRYFFNRRQSLITTVKQKLSPTLFNLFSSIFLGNRKINKKNINKLAGTFKLWGIVHFLARSGLHLLFILLFCYFFLSLLPLSWNCKQIITILLVLLYYLFSWQSLSFIRSLITFLLYRLAIVVDFPIHFLHFLTIICLGLLLYNPISLFFLDFQLTFGLTFALACFNYLNARKKPLIIQNY